MDAPADRWHWIEAPWEVWLWVVYVSWIGNVVSFWLWTSLLGRYAANRVAPFSFGVPVLGILAGTLILHETVTLWQWIGGALVMLALAYTTLRFIEATGLWLAQAWGEYLGALSGGIYIPFEVTHFIDEPSWMNAFIVALNATIVGYLVYALWRRHQLKANA